MQRQREGRNDFFRMDDPFSNFRGFGLMPSLFGGRDPFDDPFFTRPFASSIFEPGRFEPSISAAVDASHPSRDKGVFIEELDSEDEGVNEDDTQSGNERNETQKHFVSGPEPFVEHPDEAPTGRKVLNVDHKEDYNRGGGTEPQTRSHSFQTCKVTYGGVDGAYYTSTRTRRADNNGVVVEESKEADKTTGQATHRVSRGIHDKGHSVTRKLKSDGNVDTMQTLHNLNEDELTGFEEAWKGNFKGPMHGWSNKFGSSSSEQDGMGTQGGWALPSSERFQNAGRRVSDANSSGARTKKVVRINIE